MKEPLFSIRMRAARGDRHISGAERLAGADCLDGLAAGMVKRALGHPKGLPDSISLTIEEIDLSRLMRIGLPDIRTVGVDSVAQGRNAALAGLLRAGISEQAARSAMQALAGGAAPNGESMRGAMLVDALDGRRLEFDAARGVRVSRMDLEERAAAVLARELQAIGLNNTHVREALVLAAKVLHAPGVLAELCWSDDPDYTAGYVAAPCLGYVRFPLLKPRGEDRGGRAFFLAPGTDVTGLYCFLEKQAVLVDRVGRMLPDERWRACP
ncbi:6-carboxyhexanoate--CoA ligase [Syntrophotalea acetylenica]|jgi:6-carboxyhexanoate--CoA ligase|uniref:6-carboxyhexanoate--CoA ligase n=1 Tax=Syntrophotalea acetylenica TaxID=29542 RepID=UPI002A35ED00|nr:6-carboxyhexanoate--CoA ligase [Syntrophotalea acetylenica]MDY0262311.1 6-carboxyhexanoate--CoA ligase [Syntrophotalea acetylenica]